MRAVVDQRDPLDRADAQPAVAHLGAGHQPGDLLEHRDHVRRAAAPRRPHQHHGHHGRRERADGERPRHPSGRRGFAPQKTSVPTIEMAVTPMMLTAIDRAVAVPTSTGPPRTPSPKYSATTTTHTEMAAPLATE